MRRQISAILAQAYRRRLVLGLLQSIDSRERERILDIGSGTGALAADLRRRFPAADIAGIELSREGVERARIAVPSATFVQRDLLTTMRRSSPGCAAGRRPRCALRSWSTSMSRSACCVA
jgi:trans-aconitate methyltransferase